MDAARAGDRAAFGHLYEGFARMVHGCLLARLQPADADDLVQDVFLHAMAHLGELRDGAAFGPWLRTIARNRVNDHYRRSRPTVEVPEDLPAADGRPHAAAEAREVLAIVRALPEAYRETLILRLVEGMSGPEIALRTGLTEGSVRVNLHRGMKLLQERLCQVPA